MDTSSPYLTSRQPKPTLQLLDVFVTCLQGCRSMLAIPISFVSEHIETLEEMDMEYRELAMESGIQRRVPESFSSSSVWLSEEGVVFGPASAFILLSALSLRVFFKSTKHQSRIPCHPHQTACFRWRRLPALNTNRTFIDDLADAVLEALPFAGSMAGSNPSDSLVPLGARSRLGSCICRPRMAAGRR